MATIRVGKSVIQVGGILNFLELPHKPALKDPGTLITINPVVLNFDFDKPNPIQPKYNGISIF